MRDIEDYSPDAALAALMWQVELGVDEAIAETPFDRFAQVDPAPQSPNPQSPTRQIPTSQSPTDEAAPADEAAQLAQHVAQAQAQAQACHDLPSLCAAMAEFPHCDLRHGARKLVFGDGHAQASVMVLGEAPNADDDLSGRPYSGADGALLDAMFAAIGMGRAADDPRLGLYACHALPWRPPAGRSDFDRDIALMRPFVLRHIALVGPKILVLMGNLPCQMILGQTGVARLRGRFVGVDALAGVECMAFYAPQTLRASPLLKRDAWQDLLRLRAKLGV